jgi:hypothetical protein
MPKLPVSVLIPVKNEAANLPRCLASVAWADEIIVVDSHSTDATRAIAEAAGATVIDFDYLPPWPKKKQWALDTIAFRNDWILILDADETMPQNSAAVLAPFLSAPLCPTSPVGYWINRRFYFLGALLKHAYTPNWNLRLLRRGHAHFERLTSVETHSGDSEVHEHLLCDGATARLDLVMEHYAFPTTEIFLEKHLRYAAWEAAVELHPTAPTQAPTGIVGLRRTLKKLSRGLPLRPFWRMLWVLFGEKAILDGRRGWLFARLHGVYETLIAAKKLELKTAEAAKTAPRNSSSR